MESHEIAQLVGISADGSEDWSREFVLDEEIPLAILKSISSSENERSLQDVSLSIERKVDSVDEDEEDWNIDLAEIEGDVKMFSNDRDMDQKAEVDGDDEDWDFELGIADEVKEAQDYLADGLRLVMSDMVSMEQIRGIDDFGGLPDPQTTTEPLPITIPNRCKMARNLLNSSGSVNLVIFPKPPTLYSLKLDRSRKQYSAVEFDDWLQTIVSKHLSRVLSSSQGKDQHWLTQIRLKERIPTAKLITAWSQYIQILWRNREIDQLFQSLSQLCQFLTQNPSPDKNQKSFTEEASHELFEYVCHILRITLLITIDRSISLNKSTSRNSHGSSKSPGKNKIRISFQFQILLTELSSSPATSFSQKSRGLNVQFCCQVYHDLLQMFVTLYPTLRDRFALFELQCASYFSTMMLEHNLDSSNWSPKPANLLQFYVQLYRQLLLNEKRYRSSKPLLSLPSFSEDQKDLLESNVKHGNLIKLEILCDIFLFLNGFIPLFISPNRHLQNAISKLNHLQGNPQGNYGDGDDDEEEEEDEYTEDGSNEGEGEEDATELDLSYEDEAESSDLESQSRSNSQEIDQKYIWASNNLTWMQPPHTTPHETSTKTQSSTADGDDSDAGTGTGPMPPRRYLTNDSIDSFRIYKEENISKLTNNRSSISIVSNLNDSATITSNNTGTGNGSISLLEEILADEEDLSLDILFHFFHLEINHFYNILKTKYPYISRKYLLKSKVLFLMTLLNLSSNPPSQPVDENTSAAAASAGASASGGATGNISRRESGMSASTNTLKGFNLNDLIESFFFECLMLLDRQSKETFNVLHPSIMTSFGMIVLEKFADTLVKNTKYKFGSSCLESILCFHTMRNSKHQQSHSNSGGGGGTSGGSSTSIGAGIQINEIKLLYRRLISVSQVASDHKKSLYYYSKILKIAKKENKLNEFVYMSELMSKLLLEFGEYLLAERCLSVMCLLHFGTPLLSIEFEYIDISKFEFTDLPQGIELPKVSASIAASVTSSSFSSSSSTPTAAASGAAAAANGGGGSGTWNLLSNNPLSPHPRYPPNGQQQPHYSFTPSLSHTPSPHTSSPQLSCDSQQLSSVLKLIDLFMFSDQYEVAIDYCLSLLKRKLFPQGRSQVLTQLAICFMKLRKLDYCEATLDRIALEADEIVSSLLVKQTFQTHLSEGSHSATSGDGGLVNGTGNGNGFGFGSGIGAPSPRKFPVARFQRASLDGSNKHSSIKQAPLQQQQQPQQQRDHSRSISSDAPGPIIVSASALSCVSKIKSYSYLYLRAKCRYYANDPEWTLHWLQIALSVCPKGKWDWRGKIRCLMGKAYVKLCLRSRNSSSQVVSLDPTGSQNKRQSIENSFAASAEEEFANAISLYKKNSDILKQIKCRNRIIELHLSRLFYSITVEGKSLHSACSCSSSSSEKDKEAAGGAAAGGGGGGEMILKSIENLCRTNLQQVGDTSTPLELIRTLLNCSEISWLQENHPLASSSWTEARNLLTITYLQHISSDSKLRQQPQSQPQNSTASAPAPGIGIGLGQHPSYVISDPVNPLGDIPVLAVPFSVGMLTKLFDILTRMIRIGFFIDPSPLNHNGVTLIGTWLRLNNFIKDNVKPLFSENQVLQKSLESYNRIFNSSSPKSTSSPRLPESETNGSPGRQLVEEIPLLAHRPRLLSSPPTPLPPQQLRPHLTRATLSSVTRRSKTSSRSSNSLNESIGFILKDQGDVPGIIRQLSLRTSQDEDEAGEAKKRPHQILRSGSDVAVSDAIDGVVLEVVSATSNILLPFEIIRKAMSVEAHCDSSSREGLKATEIILQHLRTAGRNALFSTFGEEARNIISRAAAPGLTMTSEGYFVPGVLENSAAESLAKAMLQAKVIGSSPLELNILLKRTATKSKHQSNGKLLTFRRQTDRLQSLFLQLKVFTIQYTEGRLSLTDLYKRNNDVLRRIARSSRGVYDSPRTELLKNSSPELPLDETLISNADSNDQDHDQTIEDDGVLPSTELQLLSHSHSFSDAFPNDGIPTTQLLPQPSQYSKIFPLSFRFVLLIENYLFLYLPSEQETSVMVLKDKIRTMKLSSPFVLRNSQSQSKDLLSDCETIVTNTTNNSLVDATAGTAEGTGTGTGTDDELIKRRSAAFVSMKNSSKKLLKHSDSVRATRPRGLSRRKSGYHTLTSTSSMNTLSSVSLPDGKEELFFAMSGVEGRQSITEIQPLFFQPSDLTVNDALASLPLPRDEPLTHLNLNEFDERERSSETKLDNKIDNDKPKSKFDHNIAYSLRILGLPNLLFLVNALMMEESILVVGPPGFEHNIFHICTALLRLIRPLCWQHLYLPFMQSTMQSIFKLSLKSREPFLIGTFYEVVEDVQELLKSYMKNCHGDHMNSSHGGLLSDVVIVDAKSGYVKPSRRMRFAATCCLSSHAGVVPEADPNYLKTILEKLESERRNGPMTFKPPLPARYRFEIYLKLLRIASVDDAQFLTYLPQDGGSSYLTRESKLLKWSIRLQDGFQSAMLSLLKGLVTHVKPDTVSDKNVALRSPTGATHHHKHTSSDFSIASRDRGLLNEEQFLSEIEDDVKPYLQYLGHTRSFKKFVEDLSIFKSQLARHQQQQQQLRRSIELGGSPQPSVSASTHSHGHSYNSSFSVTYPSLQQLFSSAELVLANRRDLYSSLAVERLGGFMTTYFFTLPDPGQPYPFFYTFPYGYDDLVKNKQRKGSLKVKKRWCVLDAFTLTYYKSRSQRLIKDHIRIDPSTVRLVTSPFAQPLIHQPSISGGQQTTIQYSNPALSMDLHRCALEYGENEVLVFRMETLEEHIRWTRALKARLAPRDD